MQVGKTDYTNFKTMGGHISAKDQGISEGAVQKAQGPMKGVQKPSIKTPAAIERVDVLGDNLRHLMTL